MPALAALIKALFGNASGLLLALVSTRYGVAVFAVGVLAALYVAAVGAFTGLVQPLVSAIFSTAFGQVLGLVFPPISGTIMAAYTGLWLSLMGFRYYSRFAQLLVPR